MILYLSKVYDIAPNQKIIIIIAIGMISICSCLFYGRNSSILFIKHISFIRINRKGYQKFLTINQNRSAIIPNTKLPYAITLVSGIMSVEAFWISLDKNPIVKATVLFTMWPTIDESRDLVLETSTPNIKPKKIGLIDFAS